MLIGELAATTATTTKTLRFYEEVGLLPAPVRSANGYRDFGDDSVTRVRFIKAAQGVGLTLAQIRRLLVIRDDGRSPCSAAAELIDAQIDGIAERISELQAMKRDLAALRDRARQLDPDDCAAESVCHVINPGPCHCHAHSGAVPPI